MSGLPTSHISLTARDYAILRGIALHRPLAPRGYYTLLSAKLVCAEVVENVAEDVATLDSLVRYRVGAGSTLEHRLVVGSFESMMGTNVSVRSMVGLALIGARAGHEVDLPGREETRVAIETVSPAPRREWLRASGQGLG